MKNADVISGFMFGGLALWLLAYGIPHFTSDGFGYGMTPSQLPTAMAVAILVLSAFQVVNRLRQGNGEDTAGEKKRPAVAWRAHLVFWLQTGGLFALFLLGLHLVGFLPSAVVFLVLLQLFAGQRRIVLLVVLALAISAVLYVSFRYGLGILLPTGIVFG